MDWGDGNTDNNVTGDATHIYTTVGVHRVTISGTFPRIQFRITKIPTPPFFSYSAATRQIQTIEQWGDIAWASMAGAFQGCLNLVINAADDPDLSKVTNMSGMFLRAVLTGDISGWDVSNVTDMSTMFSQAGLTNIDINDWDVSNVTNMSEMFQGWSSIGDISKWNVSSVTNMSGMFSNNRRFNGDISRWNVSNVTDMSWMFNFSAFNGDISGWNVSSVTDMSWMFNFSAFNGDISGWDVSNVTDMRIMFKFSPMSSENYDALLIGWSTLDTNAGETRIPTDIGFFGPPANYTCLGETARTKLINDHSWRIRGDNKIDLLVDNPSLPVFTAQCEIADKAALAALTAAPTAKDACSGGSPITATLKLGTLFPIKKDTTITWTYVMGTNIATQTQQVVVSTDALVLAVNPLPPLNEQCEVDSLTAPKATNCSGTTVTATNDVASLPITASQTITWTYTDGSNTATQTQEVTITDCPPEEIDPLPLSATDDALEAVVFPNPSGRYVEVRSPVESPIHILSVGGELVLGSTTNTSIDAASLQSGLYLIQLQDGRLLKFVKQ
ncbi:MAG: BspA family leucine-rich repeat surface protein [Ekhidna sp.]|nr:BspA family leucine-rich repeat surface protein [Ekhidna sp.]